MCVQACMDSFYKSVCFYKRYFLSFIFFSGYDIFNIVHDLNFILCFNVNYLDVKLILHYVHVHTCKCDDLNVYLNVVNLEVVSGFLRMLCQCTSEVFSII